ncbi:hypothetical protein FRC06_000702 [Ceratobasidium sp. 370]|nr:hypothetical protein FRC06_000702 [Ceratobasidium sp. 370]
MPVPVESIENQSQSPHLDLKGILTSFGHAASCFANAATALSGAAQALAIAADALSEASNKLESLDLGQIADSAGLANPVAFRSPAPEDPALVASSQNMPPSERELDKQPLDDESDTDTDNDYVPDENEDYIQALIKRQREESVQHDNSVNSRLESATTQNQSLPDLPPADEDGSTVPRAFDIPILELLKHEPPFQRSLLVDSQADVLPVACIFAQSYDKVLCYLDCPLPSILLFQKIIKGVTESSVYAASRASASELNSLCRAFNKQNKAVLLLHETVHSDLTITATDELCVIHVGWPADAVRFVKTPLRFAVTKLLTQSWSHAASIKTYIHLVPKSWIAPRRGPKLTTQPSNGK